MSRNQYRVMCLQYHLWDNDAAEELLRSKFPDFVDTWESYDMVVLRGALLPSATHTNLSHPPATVTDHLLQCTSLRHLDYEMPFALCEHSSG